MAVKQPSHGFSLVELMVVMVIVALLAMAALPFTRAWTDGAKQSDFRNQVARSIGQAQSLAVRNPDGMAQGTAVVRLELSDGRLEVLNAHSGNTEVLLVVPQGLSLLDNTGAALGCVEWDNRRTLVTDNGCTVARKAVVRMNGQTDLDVELL